MSDTGKAVFLSYASQDAEAAKRICEDLRAAGVEVWFDAEGGLEHGDEWDAKIRRQIKECVLFIPLISANTQAREEGYFRIEWDLAAERARGIASGIAFILPVVIDDTREPQALVPDRFRVVQWTRLPGGTLTPEVKARYLKLWSHRTGVLKQEAAQLENCATALPTASLGSGRSPALGRWLPWAAALVVASAAIALWQPWRRGDTVTVPASATAPQTDAQRLIARMWVLYEKQDDGTGPDWALAEELAAQAVKLEPANADAWAAYSQATLGSWVFGYDRTAARLVEARSRAERALGLAPESFEARFAMANCHRRQVATRFDAEKALRALIAERPTDKRVIRMLAQTLRDLQRTDEAIQWLDRAAALPGGDPIAVWGKFAVYSAAGRYEEAEAAVTQSLAIRRGPSALLRQVAVRLVWHGDLEGAATALRDVPGPFLLKADGVYVSYLLGRWRRDPNACLAALQLAGGDVIEGSNYLPSPNSAVPTGLWRGDAYALAGNRDAAEKNWRDALAVVERRAREQPDENGWTFWRASLQARLGERVEGLRSLRLFQQLTGAGTGAVSVASSARQAGALNTLVLLGEHDEALAGWEKAMATAPTPRHREVLRHELRLDPLYDGWRDRPRFRALVAAPSPSAVPPADEKSLVVLPLENLSPDPENAFFTDGIHAEIIATLQRRTDLKVIGRDSALALKRGSGSLAELAARVGAANVMTGSVRRSGTKVRILLELRRASDEALLWASPDGARELGSDVFELQSEIAKEVVRVLQARERKGWAGGAQFQTNNAQALDLFFKAQQITFGQVAVGDPNVQKTVPLLEAALRLDPHFVSAMEGLARAHISRFRGLRDSRQRALHAAEAKRWAEAAAREVAGGAGDHALAIYYLWVESDLPRALTMADNVIRAIPNDAAGWNLRGLVFSQMGRDAEALEALDRCLGLDPLVVVSRNNRGWLLSRLRRWPEAETAFAETLPLLPDRNQLTDSMQVARFARTGKASPVDHLPTTRRVPWLIRLRQPAAALAATEQELGVPDLTDADAFFWRTWQYDALRQLQRDAEAGEVARAALALAEKLQNETEFDPAEKDRRMARALMMVGRMDDAIATQQRVVDSYQRRGIAPLAWGSRTMLAEFYARAGRKPECFALLGTLLKEPSGLTVSVLRVVPAWDPVRDDPAFQALLNDPRNDTPL